MSDSITENERTGKRGCKGKDKKRLLGAMGISIKNIIADGRSYIIRLDTVRCDPPAGVLIDDSDTYFVSRMLVLLTKARDANIGEYVEFPFNNPYTRTGEIVRIDGVLLENCGGYYIRVADTKEEKGNALS